MKRLWLASLLVFFILLSQICFTQNSFNAESIGKSFDIRRIDFTNLSSETLPSRVETYAFKFSSFNPETLKSEGVTIENSPEQDLGLETFFVLTDYDYETTLLDKIAKKTGMENYALAMFSSAYNFNFKDFAEPDFLYVYSSFYKRISELKLNYESKALSDTFIDEVNRLGRDISAAGFLFRNGTHFVSKAHYGGHFILRNGVRKDAYTYSAYAPEEFANEIKTIINEDNSGVKSDLKSNPNRINVGNSEVFTIGGDKAIKEYSKWEKTVNSNPELIGIELTRISRLLTRKNFPNIENLEYKRKIIDSFIDLAEREVFYNKSQQRQHSFFNRGPIKFKQKVTTIEKIDSGYESASEYTGVLFMGFFGEEEALLKQQRLFGRQDGDMKSYFTEEVITLNKILQVEVDSIDLKQGYVSVWDDAKKFEKSQQRTALRYSGTQESKTKFTEAMNVKVTKKVSIQTIDDDRYDVEYTLERVRDYNDFDNSSFIRNDVMDTELIAAASNGEIDRLKQMYRSGANKLAKGVIKATITSPQVSVDVLNAIMDEGVKPTTEDLEAAFDPDYFNPNKAIALLERGAKPKNNMIYKSVAYNYPSVVYALLRENAKPINNDLDFAVRKKRYQIAKALMDSGVEGYVANEESIDLAVQNEDEDMTRKFLELGGTATSATFSQAVTVAQRKKNRTIVNLITPVTEANNESLEAAARINDVELYKLFISKDAKLTDNSSVNRAIENKNKEILEIALENNAEPTQALQYAIEKDNKEAVVLSLDNKADPDETFDYAVKKGDTQLFEEVLNKYEGNTTRALEASLKGENIDLAKAAIDKGNADVSSQLDEVVREKDLKWVNLLIESGANPNLGIETSITAKKPDISKLLLEKGADANKAIVAASKDKQPEMVRLALEYNADATLGIKDAIENNDTETALLLLESGANPSGMLKAATNNLNIQLVEKLLESGSDPNEAIQSAIDSDSVILVEKLIAAGADVKNPDYLYKAFQNNNGLLAEILHDNGCIVSHKFPDGNTYLHAIAEKEEAGDLMQTFITFGLDVNKKNNQGETPLHIAVQKGNKNFYSVLALLEAGANVHAKTNKKKRVFKLARGIEIKNILADYGADE